MINWGTVPAGSVLPFHFPSYDGATGASEAISGLAVTDIEVYKGITVTQRSSDNGYALIDTDGIDIDGMVGANGFSVDTGDNTDAGFYAAGSFYTVWVASITADGQTVNFIAGTFRLGVAESTAGTPVVDVGRISNDATAADNAEAFFDGTGYAGTGNTIPTVTTLTGHTAQTGDAYARLGAPAGASVSADVAAVKAQTAAIETDTQDIQARLPAALTAGGHIKADALAVSGDTVAADNLEAAADGTGYNLGGGSVVAASVTGAVGSVTAVSAGAITAASHAAGAIDAAALAADAGQEIADAILARNVAGGSSAGRTVKQALAVLRNKVTVSGGTLTVYDTDDTTILYTAAVTTAAGDPIDSIDP